MNNLVLVKVFIFFAAVFAALGGTLHRFFGFLAGIICIAVLLILFFCMNDEKQNNEKAEPEPKKYKNYDHREPSASVPVPNIKEVKNDNPEPKPVHSNGDFQRRQEEEFAKEAVTNEALKLINKFASVASHDLKNPLSSIKNIAYYFSNSVKIEGEIPNKMLRMLSGEADRMNEMIVDLLDSTRVKQLNKEKSDLDLIINEAVQERKNDKYSYDINLQKLQVYADFKRMKQVFSSIIKNAEESMPEGGTVLIKAYESSHEAYIEISDMGTGMDEQTLAHCFDPMFSTKKARALGMSLTVAKQIVTMHGGIIKAESVQGKGSKFTVNLPLSV
ncbi:MAG: HAMP domain-containing histidine kinase [Endomicrobium sp.]|jgi:signal transduction histidine kinase|nr:HAMP domain-containing histidine kinase [Endomicrobium sp.]